MTDQILELIGDPTEAGPWARRGLVIGEVQSGKTSSYIGLLNKAEDAGYRIFILLGGHTEALRQQTQRRVDEGFIGRDSRTLETSTKNLTSQGFVGVGTIRRDLAGAMSPTTVLRDFSRATQKSLSVNITHSADTTYVLVVKKNKHVLEALYSWLSHQLAVGEQVSAPMLLLDDESDYASINTSAEDTPTVINSSIRALLSIFERSTYVAYTATPFANIFIDDAIAEDLFPRDFVYFLGSPDNYVGAKRIFGTTEYSESEAVVYLQDAEDVFPFRHKQSLIVTKLPASLQEAIRVHIASIAVLQARGLTNDTSMMINVSRFIRVQDQVYRLVREEISVIRNAVQLHLEMYKRNTPNTELAALRAAFEKYLGELETTWEDIVDYLPTAVRDVGVSIVNSATDRRLDESQEIWDRPTRLIAVGGDVLSRGLTLEGLITTYVYRNPKASDTLLQMARWFGYRDGYEDLCRVWIAQDMAADYRFVDDSVDELRTMIRRMSQLRLTPEQFGLAVKKHPGSLLITAKNKMRSAVEAHYQISVAGRIIETSKLRSDPSILEENRKALWSLIASIDRVSTRETASSGRSYTAWRGIDKSLVAEFINKFVFHPEDAIFSQHAIGDFIERTPRKNFALWDVILENGELSPSHKLLAPGSTIEFYPPRRQMDDSRPGLFRVSGNRARLAGSTDVASAMEQEHRLAAKAEIPKPENGKGISERAYYPFLNRPLLMIYPLIKSENSGDSVAQVIDIEDIIVGVKLAFPGDPISLDSNSDVSYMINTVAQREWLTEIEELDDNISDLDA